jgi:hypothetical protein
MMDPRVPRYWAIEKHAKISRARVRELDIDGMKSSMFFRSGQLVQVDEPVRSWQHPSQLADGSFGGRGSNPGPQSHTAWWFLKWVRFQNEIPCSRLT